MLRRVEAKGQWVSDEELSKKRFKEVHEANVRIFRFDPSRDKESRFETYSVPLVKDMSVLGVLVYIYENIDSSLAFYYSCRAGRCGGCTVLVNGKATQACTRLATENMTVEPLQKRKVIKDLLVEL